ncbi:Sodium-dependent dopamine transporter [Orchesella cincta]|uniref:Sodium-dependent nutrient amino acid transporter 1 n=1 Tax=Orchesella cincta TaxID=48709 RepID=A0A1D2NHD1_ORCCI|nr:Sodium-dependent dopamine transporter [Orchesella cincta]
MMLDALSKALLTAVDVDEKLQSRRSKRISKVHPDGTFVQESAEDVASMDGTGQKDEDRKTLRRSTVSEEDDDEDLQEDRDKWGDDNLVLLYMVGYAVGLSNVWRFPFLCYQFGGGAFVIPYFTFLVLCAYPFVYLELLVGQFAQVGVIASWKYTVPLFKGVGICMTIIVILSCINMNTVIAWCLFYLFQTLFRHPLPWISCDNGFARKRNGQIDPDMYKSSAVSDLQKVLAIAKSDISNAQNWHTENCSEYYADSGTEAKLLESERLPGAEFLRGRVQRMWRSAFADNRASHPEIPFNHTHGINGLIQYGLDEPHGVGSINTDTVIALFVGFVIIAICVSRGIRINGKIILSAVLIPYVVLALLMFRATGLTGAASGLLYMFHPKFEQLANPQAWRKAAEQVFLSTGCGIGVHLTLASHNRVNHNILRDATAVIIVNTITSILAAIVIFMFLGHIQYTVGRSIDRLIISGPELVFETMADVLGELAQSNFYAFCFYFMLLLLGLATSICSLICVKIAIIEVLPITIKYKVGSRLMLTFFMAFICFILSACNLTRGGLQVFAFFETFVGSFSLLTCVILFLIAIAWIFGLRELADAAVEMGIPQPGIYFQICWKYIGIILLFIVFCGSVASPESYNVKLDQTKIIKLPTPVLILGYVVALGPLLAVLLGALHAFSRSPGRSFCMKLLLSISPAKEYREIMDVGHGKRSKISHYIYWYAHGPCGCCKCKSKNKIAPTPSTVVNPPAEEPRKSLPTENPDPDQPPAEGDMFDDLFQELPHHHVPEHERPSNYSAQSASANVSKLKPPNPANASRFS